jgi:broad specificity phosphatase PhoE
MSLRVVALRHASVVPEWRGRWTGAGSDPDADPEALRALWPCLARLAARLPPSRVLVSPLRRARQTAALLGRPLELEPRLEERHFGRWEGRAVAECLRGVDPAHLASADRYLELPVPGAERPEVIAGRAASLWRDLEDEPGPIWCVGHGGSLRALAAAACLRPLAWAFGLSLPPGGWLILGETRAQDGPVKRRPYRSR